MFSHGSFRALQRQPRGLLVNHMAARHHPADFVFPAQNLQIAGGNGPSIGSPMRQRRVIRTPPSPSPRLGAAIPTLQIQIDYCIAAKGPTCPRALASEQPYRVLLNCLLTRYRNASRQAMEESAIWKSSPGISRHHSVVINGIRPHDRFGYPTDLQNQIEKMDLHEPC